MLVWRAGSRPSALGEGAIGAARRFWGRAIGAAACLRVRGGKYQQVYDECVRDCMYLFFRVWI